MDDMERFATTALLLLVIIRLVKEVKGVLEPMPRWPAGGREAIERKKSEGEEDDDWLTPEEEFERWAKGGARPGRKRIQCHQAQHPRRDEQDPGGERRLRQPAHQPTQVREG